MKRTPCSERREKLRPRWLGGAPDQLPHGASLAADDRELRQSVRGVHLDRNVVGVDADDRGRADCGQHATNVARMGRINRGRPVHFIASGAVWGDEAAITRA